MKRKVLILFDAIIIIAAIIGISISTTMPEMMSAIRQTKALKGSEDLGFNFIPSQDEVKLKAGETVTIKVNVADINVGENGLNSIIGFLNYDELLFELTKIQACENWIVELNQEKRHPLYGKFCIYTMQEGIKENQQIATLTMKLKSDISPQTTAVEFSNIVSSDGSVGIIDQDRKIESTIYKDEILDNPDNPGKQDNLEIPNKQTTPGTPITGDQILIIAVAVIGLVAIANILIIIKNKKGKIIAAVIVGVIFMAAIATAVFAMTPEETQQLTQLSKQESWLNSTKYLITDGNIARVSPKTSIENFKNTINKSNIKIYDNQQAENYNQTTTKQNIATDMKIKVDDESQSYLVSVLGDLDCYGNANQVELTRIIRNIINSTKWAFAGNKIVSADLTCDSQISVKDVESLVKYIIYEELEIPEVVQVVAPTVEVTEGSFDETQNCYTGEVTVKIIEKELNLIKTMYKIEGKTEQGYTILNDADTVNLTENGIYKISAYTYGAKGNRSTVSSKII